MRIGNYFAMYNSAGAPDLMYRQVQEGFFMALVQSCAPKYMSGRSRRVSCVSFQVDVIAENRSCCQI